MRVKRFLLLPLFVLAALAGVPAAAQTSTEPSPVPGPALASPVEPSVVNAPWTRRIDGLVAGKAMSVVVGKDGTFLYRFKPVKARTPASNEKLLTSMAILAALDPDERLETMATAEAISDEGIVDGPLWIIGAGDPEIGPARMSVLARELDRAGVTKVVGSVRGSVTVFSHDWWAPGWKPYFPAQYVALPSALAFNHNTAGGRHISDPERRAAASLTEALRDRGIRVTRAPGAGKAPAGLEELASIRSVPLITILRRMNVPSDNWYAEMMGKLLGSRVVGRPGTIAKGAKAIDAFAAAHGGEAIRPNDASGLSYDDRVTADAMVRLLFWCDEQLWAEELRWALPTGGEGTLSSRLKTLDVRAKTGTLTNISALSGWVRSERSGEWIEFSILSRGMSKTTASHIEDRIVTIVANAVQ